MTIALNKTQAAVEAALSFMRHSPLCETQQPGLDICTCGMEEAYEQLRTVALSVKPFSAPPSYRLIEMGNEIMGAKHTPGPWSATAPDGSYHDVIRVFADADPEGAVPVTIIPQRQSAIMSVMAGQTNGTTEAAANARLIAAAPELLAALEKAAPFIGWASTRGQILAGVDAGELCGVIDAAIAKARGSHHDQ